MKVIRLLFIFFLFIAGIETFIVYGIPGANRDFTRVLEFQLVVVYFGWLFYYLKRDGIGGIFTLFLIFLSLFNFQKIFLGGLIGDDYRYAYSLIQISLEEIVVQKTLLIFSVFTYFVSFFYAEFRETDRKTITLQSDEKLYRIGKFVMLFFLVFAAYRSYLEFTSLFGKAYTEYYTEDGGSNIPSFIKLTTIFFQVGFMMVLASIPKKRNFYFLSIIYLLVLVPNLFTGLRATFAVTFVVIFWYYVNIYKVKINYFKVIAGALTFILLMQGVAAKRSNEESKLGVFGSAIEFLHHQSQSMYVLSLYIQYEDDILPHTYPFVLDPFVGWMFPSGQSEDVISKRSAIGHQLTYSLNPSYYLSGSSLGTSFITELYEFGIFGVIIGAPIFAYFIAIFDRKYKRNRLVLFLSLILLSYFFIAPRSAFLPSFYFIFRCLLIYLIILYVFKFNVKKYFSWK